MTEEDELDIEQTWVICCELDIEQVWVICCCRCSHEATGGDTKSEAMESFLAKGGGIYDGYQMCPECRGVR